MNILYLLIGISLVFILLIVFIFFWAVRSGQYDDLEKPRHDILMEQDEDKEK